MGASLKSRSTIESCWFSIRTTPRSRGEDFKTQNGKNNVRTGSFRNCRIYRRNPDGWREKISGRRRRRFASQAGCLDFSEQTLGDAPACRHYLRHGSRQVFHGMEKFLENFPHYGKYLADISTEWKNFSPVFHTMERMFPRCGKLGFRAVYEGFRLLARGC